MEKLY
jgi:hypothetical protein